MAEETPELEAAEVSVEEHTDAHEEVWDEVVAAQAEVEKTVAAQQEARDAYMAASGQLTKSMEVLKNTTLKMLIEAAPDEWAALNAAWDALGSALHNAMKEKSPLDTYIDQNGENEIAKKFAPVEYEAWINMVCSGSVELAFKIAIAVDSLILAAKSKQVAPVEWAAYEEAVVSLKEKALNECGMYEDALEQAELRCTQDGLAFSIERRESRASRVRAEHEALLDTEWHAKWAEQMAYYVETFEPFDGDISYTVAALAAMFQAFESAQKTGKITINSEIVPDPYKAVERAYFAVHKAFRKILSSMDNEWSEWYDELIRLKSEADKDRQEQKASS